MRQGFGRDEDLSPGTVVMTVILAFILMILHHFGQTLCNETRCRQRIGLAVLQLDHRIGGYDKTGV